MPAAWRLAIKHWPIYLAAAYLSTVNAHAAEVCHFAGTTDYSGRIAVTTKVSAHVMDNITTVDVIGRFVATPMPLVHINYLMEEFSTLEIWSVAEPGGE